MAIYLSNAVHAPIAARTSHTKRFSSHPVLAHHPSLPNIHQSTPVTNSVCWPIRPNSIPIDGAGPERIVSRSPIPASDPSLHARQVMS